MEPQLKLTSQDVRFLASARINSGDQDRRYGDLSWKNDVVLSKRETDLVEKLVSAQAEADVAHGEVHDFRVAADFWQQETKRAERRNLYISVFALAAIITVAGLLIRLDSVGGLRANW